MSGRQHDTLHQSLTGTNLQSMDDDDGRPIAFRRRRGIMLHNHSSGNMFTFDMTPSVVKRCVVVSM